MAKRTAKKTAAAAPEAESKATRKKLWTPAALREVEPQLIAIAGKFAALAQKLDEEGVAELLVDGKSIVDNAFNEFDLFFAKANHALTMVKRDQRRQNRG